MLPGLQKAVAADGGRLHGPVVGLVQQTAGGAAGQVVFIVTAAAAAESPRDVPAEGEQHVESVERSLTLLHITNPP